MGGMGRNSWALAGWTAVVMALSGPVFAQAREAETAPEKHLELGLHARSMQASARSERAAWLTLQVPFDELARPRLAQQSSVPIPRPSPAPAAPAVTARLEASVTFEQARALADFSRRATVVALSVVGTAAERRGLDALASRARSSALLPELRLRALRNSDQALRWIPTTDDPYRITQADGTGLILEASATFRLDRLLFAREELAVARLRLKAGSERLKLEARVLEALVGLFRARELACADDADDPARATQQLKVLELFVELDALTAGWFSEHAPALGRAVWGFPEAALGQCAASHPPAPVSVTNPVASLEESE
jgi:hypothetical protein